MIVELAELKDRMKFGDRIMGLDLGSKTIGVAVSDAMLQVASAVTTIRRSKFTKDATALAELMAERNVKGLVLGWPLNMDGTEGPRCQSTRQFATNLAERADLFGFEPTIALWDERMSTMAVQRLMVEEADLSRAKRSKAVDQMAAAFILQGALDALSGGCESSMY